MNGWFVVWIIVCFLSGIMTTANGFNVRTWQYWAWLALIALAHISGRFLSWS